MKQPHEDGFDLEFLGDPSRWGLDLFGRRRCMVKSVSCGPDGMPCMFGVVYADNPLTVFYGVTPMWQAVTKKEVFPSLEELCKIWMVD